MSWCLYQHNTEETIIDIKTGEKINTLACFYKTNHVRSSKTDDYFEQLDPYDYETLEIVLKVIQSADEKNTSIQLSQVCPDVWPC